MAVDVRDNITNIFVAQCFFEALHLHKAFQNTLGQKGIVTFVKATFNIDAELCAFERGPVALHAMRFIKRFTRSDLTLLRDDRFDAFVRASPKSKKHKSQSRRKGQNAFHAFIVVIKIESGKRALLTQIPNVSQALEVRRDKSTRESEEI